MSKPKAQFVFMTCRAGAEGALKQEVARAMPAWRLSYSRPGFLTFKHTAERPLDEQQLAERSWTFARAHGRSLGKVTGNSLARLVEQIWADEGVRDAAISGEIADVHVWQREPMVSEEGALECALTPLASEVERAVRAAAPSTCTRLHRHFRERRAPAPRGSLVLDVIINEPNEWWIGCHRAVTHAARWPGGVMPISMPSHAVSRAYLKVEEAIRWSGLPLAAEDECVEIGCAPGGASQALLDRGLFVTGIDPAIVDPVLIEHPRFRHLRKRGKEVQRKEFLGVRWLAADMNIDPSATLDTVESIVTNPRLTIRGMILTLKLSDWRDAERLPDLVARVRGWGFRDVRTRQLVNGGQEICLVALRRKALRRIGRKPDRKKSVSRRRKPAAAKVPRRRDRAHESPTGPHF